MASVYMLIYVCMHYSMTMMTVFTRVQPGFTASGDWSGGAVSCPLGSPAACLHSACVPSGLPTAPTLLVISSWPGIQLML